MRIAVVSPHTTTPLDQEITLMVADVLADNGDGGKSRGCAASHSRAI